MPTRPLTNIFTSLITNPWARGVLLLLYYAAIIAILIAMYGKGDFSTPPFVYQGF